MTRKEEMVWRYLIQHPLVAAEEAAEELGVDEKFVQRLLDKVGTPREVFEREATMKADARQVGGDHYKDMALPPWEIMEAVLTQEEFVGFLKGNIIKYSLRQGRKDSDDAGKARHYMDKLREVLG